jgi:hypothetical protein
MKSATGTAPAGSVRRYGRLGAMAAVATALVSVGFSSPAQAATNPYTPQEACHNEFGGSWSTVTDGHRSVVTTSGAKYGDVYLMYNGATGNNCVTTIKSLYVGSSTETGAWLDVKVSGGQSTYVDDHNYAYYAATQGYAAGHCVIYYAWISNASGSDGASGGRYSWGNCD